MANTYSVGDFYRGGLIYVEFCREYNLNKMQSYRTFTERSKGNEDLCTSERGCFRYY